MCQRSVVNVRRVLLIAMLLLNEVILEIRLETHRVLLAQDITGSDSGLRNSGL